MRRLHLLLPILPTLLAGLSGCAGPEGPRPGPQVTDFARAAACQPEFPYEGGWLGGDAAYSVPLPRDPEEGPMSRSLWLFGDSFVGRSDAESRVGSLLVRNSIAISECDADGDFRIQYLWGRDRAGRPKAFFDTGNRDTYWWPLDGFVRGALFVGLLVVRDSSPRGPLNLPFRFAGTQLARIPNYRDPPSDWQIDVITLSRSPVAVPGSAMVVSGDHVYFFTFLDLGGEERPRILSRLALEWLEIAGSDLSEELEYLAVDGSWKRGLDPKDAKIVMADDASEMSVHRDPQLGRWVAIYSDPDPDPGPEYTVFVRTAEALEGPWAEPRELFVFPELDPKGGPPAPGTFCYAAKAHEQFSSRDRLLVTYVCNLYATEESERGAVLLRLLEDMDLYRPRAMPTVPPAP